MGTLSLTYFNGLIDEVRIYDRALSDEEIALLAAQGVEKFDYDLLGNRQTVNLRSGADQVYSIDNTNNQYTAIDAASVSHDLAGNLTTDHRGYQYQYDKDNRLTQLKQGTAALVAEFTYDALGRRIEKIQYASPANITTRYNYDGWRVLTETDQADAVQRDYLYGNYIDEAVMMIDADDHYYAHDHLFSVTALLDDTGTVTERYEYNAYGKTTVYTDDGADNIWFTSDDTTANTSAQGNPYTFTSQRLDNLNSDALRIMYYKNRYYDVETGRFLQRDPLGVQDGLSLFRFNAPNLSNIGFSLDSKLIRYIQKFNLNTKNEPHFPREFDLIQQFSESANLYEYVLSNPIKHLDTYGEFCRVFYDCKLVDSEITSWIGKRCRYLCEEDTSIERYSGGSGQILCDETILGDKPIPSTFFYYTGTLRCFNCKKNRRVVKEWDLWDGLLDCEQKECVKNVDKYIKSLKKICKTKKCKKLATLLGIALKLGCDWCSN